MLLLGATLLGLILGAPAPTTGRADLVEEHVTIPVFGKVTVYRPEPVQKVRGVILFVSGDGGWNLGVVDMARRAARDALVVGLSMPAWKKGAEKDPGRCWFPAGELESTAQTLEKIYKLPRYINPILVGYSSGATVVYGAIAQAPAQAFAGAISLGFCSDMEVARPVCPHGDWKPSYDARKKTSLLPPRADLSPRADGAYRWTALEGLVDQVCDPKSVSQFVSKIPAARIVPLPKVGHGFSVPRNWGDAFDQAIAALELPAGLWEPVAGPGHDARADQSPDEIRLRVEPLHLPLQIVWPAQAHEVVIFISGDGGWAELDQKISEGLAARGIAVIGWNTLQYFWTARTPDEFSADLSRLVGVLPADVKPFLGGYSFGAEVSPVVLAAAKPGTQSSANALSRFMGLVLLAPGPYATFEVSPLDWIRTTETPTSHSVREAIEAGSPRPVLCLEAIQTGDSGCPQGAVAGLTREVLPGGHHFAGDFDRLAARIFAFVRSIDHGSDDLTQ